MTFSNRGRRVRIYSYCSFPAFGRRIFASVSALSLGGGGVWGRGVRRRQTCPPPGRLQSFEVQFVMLSLLLLFPNAGAGASAAAQFGCKNSGHTIPPFWQERNGKKYVLDTYGRQFFQKSCVEEGEGGTFILLYLLSLSFVQNGRKNSQNAQFAMCLQSVWGKHGF